MTRVERAATDPIPIPQLQGRGALSPYAGSMVTTGGVVTAIQKSMSSPGFYMQDIKGDGDVATSDGLFVSMAKLGTDSLKDIAVGKQVQVSGHVDESMQLTTLVATRPSSIKDIAGAVAALPEPVTLKLPNSKGQRNVYLEAREGMISTLPNALVLTPSNRFGGYVATDEGVTGLTRNRTDQPDPRHLKISGGRTGPKPQLTTGDRVSGVYGPIGVMFGDFELQQSKNYEQIARGPQPPSQWGDLDGDDRVTDRDVARIKQMRGKDASGPLDPADLSGDGQINTTDVRLAEKRAKQGTGAPAFTISTMNVKDFFDPDDAPPPIDDEVPSHNEYESKLARVASAIREKLKLPDMVAMQEVENTRVLDDLIARPELKSLGYKYALLPTEGHRSINPALLYRSDSVSVTDIRQVQKQVPLDVAASGNQAAPDANTGSLFSRQPLLVDLTVKNGEQKQDLTVVVNHLISKFSPHGEPTDPIRIEQAKFLNSLAKDLQVSHPERDVIVLGDMNDHPQSKAMKALRGTTRNPTLVDAVADVPTGERYTYNWYGTNQQIDHILVSPGLGERIEHAGVRHYNADLPENLAWGTGANRASDHDNPYVSFRFPTAPAQDAADGAAQVQPAADAQTAADADRSADAKS